MPKVDPIYIPEVKTVEELRQSLEYQINKAFTQINDAKISAPLDMNNYRIRNLARPTELHDGVNVEFLKNLMGKMAVPRKIAAATGGIPEIHWGLGVGGCPIVGDYVTPPRIITRACTPTKIYIAANYPPTGADFICDIVDSNGTSIFGATKCVLPDGAGTRQVYSYDNIFASPRPVWAEEETLSLHITQVGSTTSGRGISVVLAVDLV